MSEQVFGPYRLATLLGRGGMGEVWTAFDTSHEGRRVAIKRILATANRDDEVELRFRRECRLAAQLSHPNIMPIHRYGEIDGQLFIEMPLIEGALDLKDLLRKDGPLPRDRATKIVTAVADALDTGRRAHVIHRDVKPRNILVAARDHAYLIDFGVARLLDGTDLTRSGFGIGTASYMAPEQFDGDAEYASDIYSLGCVAFEILTGSPPFAARNALALGRLHQSAQIPRPSRVKSGIPEGVDDIIAAALAKNPRSRQPTAGKFAEELADALQQARSTENESPINPRWSTHSLLSTTAPKSASNPGETRPATLGTTTGRPETPTRPEIRRPGGVQGDDEPRAKIEPTVHSPEAAELGSRTAKRRGDFGAEENSAMTARESEITPVSKPKSGLGTANLGSVGPTPSTKVEPDSSGVSVSKFQPRTNLLAIFYAVLLIVAVVALNIVWR